MLASKFKRVRRIAWMVMDGIFKNMWDYKFVPVEIISRDSGVDARKVEDILRYLSDEDMVEVKKTEYLGGAFTFFGLSLYSLHRLVRKDYVTMIGERMGEGKESVIYNCISRWGEAILKFHKVGHVSFKRVREKRDYGSLHHTVLMVRSARNEFKALKKLYGRVSVPKPYGWEGNAVLMELIDARELYKVRIENPRDVLNYIIEEIGEMWRIGVVHGDLSQFNILVNPDGIWFIDFPQALDLDEVDVEIAKDVLKRDLSNILKYFKKTYNIDVNLEDVLKN